MAEIVNLRRAKKARARDGAAQQAAENRVRHGRSAAAKAAERQDEARRRAVLDGAKVDAVRGDEADQA